MRILEPSRIGSLLEALRRRDFTVIGPKMGDGAIIYDQISSVEDLPRGKSEEQEKAHYRLTTTATPIFFGFSLGPTSWKRFLFPPSLKLFAARRTNGTYETIRDTQEKKMKYAFFGVRPCDLAAVRVQDTVLAADPDYAARRKNLFIVAVNCTKPAPTCFCSSMDTGPGASSGFDLVLTEILESERHYFLASSGSSVGNELLEELKLPAASQNEEDNGERLVSASAASMTRRVETANIKEQLYQKTEHPRWDNIARRCLTCANCTMVCPTCFCTSVEDVTDLSGAQAERWRTWDSCFTVGFSYLHGGSIRSSVKSRYRQWLTHKFASWVEQFGTFGCVGCGRCITWCPVGIDVTEELQAICEQKRPSPPS